ncbi:hypothetical protein EIP91_009619 [Steccherinum ochraceum]|uniref:Uncharacterized protein n=1 Tax=Steccherinum ochraceum TaxID=92696 RepID=A0A4R0R3Q3_9APHY|nr:hypothetical protein EIP91_009619 [Steccherinum ochraceum]
MSAFDIDIVLPVLRATLPEGSQAQIDFEPTWIKKATELANDWEQRRLAGGQSVCRAQLDFEANAVLYTQFLIDATRVHGNSKSLHEYKPLPRKIPLYGPRFKPPQFLDKVKRTTSPNLKTLGSVPNLMKFTIVHPCFTGGWTTTGHRSVYGVARNETALGVQRRCETCRLNGDPYALATTNPLFWEPYQHWEIPKKIPFFLKRCAVTRKLYNLILELRPKSTSGGIAGHVKQFHLLEYFQNQREYLHHFEHHRSSDSIQPRPFSLPNDSLGYNDTPVTNDIVTEAYFHFAETRQQESAKYCRTLTGRALNGDSTMKVAKKAAVVDALGRRITPFASSAGGGGVFTVVNEFNEMLGFWCLLTQHNAELTRIFEGIAARYDIIGADQPEVVISDNCCHIESALKAAFPNVVSLLDVKHFGARYAPIIQGGTKNPLYRTVLFEITSAILKRRAGEEKGKPAEYWSQEEQVRRIIAVFDKYQKKGGVWTEAAVKTHNQQLHHVKKGCLARPASLLGLRLDGSRVENGNKGIGGLNHAQPCGLVMMIYLMFDFMLRRNISVGTNNNVGSAFTASTLGSHHVGLVDSIAKHWNMLNGNSEPAPSADAHFSGAASSSTKKGESRGINTFFLAKTRKEKNLRPELQDVRSGESIGLFQSPSTLASFDNLGDFSDIRLKDDSEDDDDTEAATEDEQVLVAAAAELDNSESDLALDAKHDLCEKAGGCAASSAVDTPRSPPRKSDFIDLTAEDVVVDTSTVVIATGTTTTSNTHEVVEAISERKAEKRKAADDFDTHENDIAISSVPLASTKRLRVENTHSGTNQASRALFKIFNRATSDGDFAGGSQSAAQSPSPGVSPLSVPSAASITAKPATSRSTAAAIASDTDNVEAQSVAAAVQQRRSIFAPLPLPSASANNSGSGGKLTRTQLLFQAGTHLDPRALQIGAVHIEELYLLMEMRGEKQWASFAMTSRSWSSVVNSFNFRLRARAFEKGFAYVAKSPRALQRKLGEMESKIAEKVASGNYASKSGSEVFWRNASTAVASVLAVAEGAKAKNVKSRKLQICSRCQVIMYPGKAAGVTANVNHKPGYCSDGAPVHFKAEMRDDWHRGPHLGDPPLDHPPFPQPAGIFTNKGKSFDPIGFLTALRDVYECYIVEKGTGGERASEFEAFAEMVRTFPINGGIYFKLHRSLEVTTRGESAGLVLDHTDGCKYLRMDSMQDGEGTAVAAQPEPASGSEQ